MRKRLNPAALALCLTLLASTAAADDELRQDALALFGRLEPVAPNDVTTPAAELGRALFWDVRVSLDGKTACGSCHLANDWGSDRRRASIDAKGKPTSRHSQTVFNAMSQPTLRWLGDRADGPTQAEGSLTGSMGFATKQDGVATMAKLEYLEQFKLAFPSDQDPLSARNYGKAIAAYQATLVTPAPFDRFLAGDDKALDAQQKEGLKAFIANGCATCHAGSLLGGETFQIFGVAKEYWTATQSKDIDVGRFAVTKKDEDRFVFRVPMLRNVAKTAPYFHDGSVVDLEDAVKVMAGVQLGRELEDAEVKAIVRFLDSLTGDVPAHYAPPGQKASRN